MAEQRIQELEADKGELSSLITALVDRMSGPLGSSSEISAAIKEIDKDFFWESNALIAAIQAKIEVDDE